MAKNKKARVAMQREKVNSIAINLDQAKRSGNKARANKLLNDLMLAKEFLRAEEEAPDD